MRRMLKIQFTYAGMAYYCTRFAGPEFRYAQFLCKMTYEDISRDWGVWRFSGEDIHLLHEEKGSLLVKCSFVEFE